MSDLSRRSFLSILASGGLVSALGSGAAFSKYSSSSSLFSVKNADSEDMKIIGHRGANGLAPQNTLEGIKKAAEYDADGVELDVQKTSDGELVLFHDPIYDFATDNGSGVVSNVPYEEAKEFHKNGYYVKTLDDVMDLIIEEDLELYIEAKSTGIYESCVELLSSYDWIEKTTFISLYSDYIHPFTEEYQTVLVSPTPYENRINRAKELGCNGIATHYAPIQKDSFISEANKNGLDSVIWSLVDVRTSIIDSLNTDADVLIANRPDIIQDIRQE